MEGLPTLLDIKKLDEGIGYNIIEEVIHLAPELRILPSETITGTTVSLTVRKGLPGVSFRNYNEGTARTKSEYETRTFQTYVLDHQVAVDAQLVKNAKNPGRLLENHAAGVLEATLKKVSDQFYYGVASDAKGFPGIMAQYQADADHELNVAGATAKTSVWMVSLGREKLEFLFGNNSTLNFADTWTLETVYDQEGKPYQAWTNWMTGNIGFRLANKHAAFRIKNLGTDTGKGLTDNVLFEAYEKFTGLGLEPNHLFMTGRSREQLRKSRLATNEKGNPSPLPIEWEGIPIVRTGGISNAEQA